MSDLLQFLLWYLLVWILWVIQKATKIKSPIINNPSNRVCKNDIQILFFQPFLHLNVKLRLDSILINSMKILGKLIDIWSLYSSRSLVIQCLIKCINQCKIVILLKLIKWKTINLVLIFRWFFKIETWFIEKRRIRIWLLFIKRVKNVHRNRQIICGKLLEVRKY